MNWNIEWTLLAVIQSFAVIEGCTLDTDLHGTWSSTNFGTVTIQSTSPQLSMTTAFTGATGTTTDFNCLMISGDNFILQSNNTLTVFSGTTNIYIYMCVTFTRMSNSSYIYYLNSEVENGLNGYRLVGLPISTAVTMASQVCTATLDIAEYEVMYRDGVTGYELGILQCPTPLLGLFTFVYTYSGTTYCENANATFNTCNNQSLTGILANDTGCDAANPFFSTGGILGCISSTENTATSTYYVTLYNGDTSVDNVNTYRLSCLAISSSDNDTVYISVNPTVCVSAQSATTAPSTGALMVLQPQCVPTSEDTDYTVLIVLLCVFTFLIVVIIIIIVLCYIRYRKLRKEKGKEKKPLDSEHHPLEEPSIVLEAEPAMEPIPWANGNDSFRSPRRKKGLSSNPLSETSMPINMAGKSSHRSVKQSPRYNDPFTEMDERTIVPLSPQGSKTMRSLKSRQSTFVGRPYMNGDIRTPLAIDKPGDIDLKSTMNGSVVSRKTKGEMVRSKTVIKAPSIRSTRSIKAPSVITDYSKTSGALVRVGSLKGKGRPASKPDKMSRSVTSTKIGIGGKRFSSSRSKMDRSQTMIVPTKTEDGPTEYKEDQVNAFMSGEMNPVERASPRSDGNKSKKSGKSTKSKSVMSRSSGPRRSFINKSAKMEHATLTDMIDGTAELPEPVLDRSFMSRDLTKESFRTARELREIRLRAKKPSASKGPWK